MGLLPALVLQDAHSQLESLLHTLHAHPAGAAINALALLLLLLAALRFVAGVIGFAFAYFLRPGRNLKSYGSWAVVTGATDGIGKAYCAQLAKKGINLVLISRTESKLKECAAELEAQYSIQARICTADLSKAGPDTLAKIGAALEGLEVGILVNNAGMSYDHPEYLDEVDDQVVTDIVTMNSLVPTLLSKLVLKGMRERGRGAIINIGSGAATVIPCSPLLSVYAGTKAYIDCFSRSMDAEYRSMGVRVQNQLPMFVATKMSKIRRPRLDAPSPEAWAASALKQVGYESSFTPYWFHGLQRAFIKVAPEWLINRQVMAIHQGLRARYYRSQARKQAEAAAAAVAAAAAASGGGSEGEEGEQEGAAASPGKRELRRRK